MTIWLTVKLPGKGGYRVSFSDPVRAMKAYDAEKALGHAEVTIEVETTNRPEGR